MAARIEEVNLSDTAVKIEKENVGKVNSNGAPEKHIPQVTMRGADVTVTVPHVMDPDKPHFIQYIWLREVTSGDIAVVREFQSSDLGPPTLRVTVPKGVKLKPALFCNLHGLWEGDEFKIGRFA